MPLMSPSRFFHLCRRTFLCRAREFWVHLFCLVPACLKGKFGVLDPSRLPCIERLALSGLSSSREFCVAVERAFECLSPPCLAFFRSSSVLRFNVHLNVSRFCGNAHRS